MKSVDQMILVFDYGSLRRLGARDQRRRTRSRRLPVSNHPGGDNWDKASVPEWRGGEFAGQGVDLLAGQELLSSASTKGREGEMSLHRAETQINLPFITATDATQAPRHQADSGQAQRADRRPAGADREPGQAGAFRRRGPGTSSTVLVGGTPTRTCAGPLGQGQGAGTGKDLTRAVSTRRHRREIQCAREEHRRAAADANAAVVGIETKGVIPSDRVQQLLSPTKKPRFLQFAEDEQRPRWRSTSQGERRWPPTTRAWASSSSPASPPGQGRPAGSRSPSTSMPTASCMCRPRTSAPARSKIEIKSGLVEAEMIHDAEAHADEDRRQRSRVPRSTLGENAAYRGRIALRAWRQGRRVLEAWINEAAIKEVRDSLLASESAEEIRRRPRPCKPPSPRLRAGLPVGPGARPPPLDGASAGDGASAEAEEEVVDAEVVDDES